MNNLREDLVIDRRSSDINVVDCDTKSGAVQNRLSQSPNLCLVATRKKCCNALGNTDVDI